MTAETPFAEHYPPLIMQQLHESAQASASAVVPLLLAELLQVQRVLDVGCGLGTWLAAFIRAGITDVFGMDGPWVDREALVIPSTCFRGADLQMALQLAGKGRPRSFDLALCLEVAEHLPADCAAPLVLELTTVAPVVFFSAAFPGQGGYEHVNERPPDYWATLFAAHGYRPRELPGLAETPPFVHFWYKNARLYERRDA